MTPKDIDLAHEAAIWINRWGEAAEILFTACPDQPRGDE